MEFLYEPMLKRSPECVLSPQAMTDDPELRIASSLIDYLFRRLAVEYLTAEEREKRNLIFLPLVNVANLLFLVL